MQTAVYVDGFNLYKGMLEFHPELKWLDLLALARALLPQDTIVKVRYFTRPYMSEPVAQGHRSGSSCTGVRSRREPTVEIHKGHSFAAR